MGVGAVASLPHCRVGVGLVGDEDLEAVADLVGESQLVPGARVGPLAAADRPGALWPARTGKIQRGKLGDPGARRGRPSTQRWVNVRVWPTGAAQCRPRP